MKIRRGVPGTFLLLGSLKLKPPLLDDLRIDHYKTNIRPMKIAVEEIPQPEIELVCLSIQTQTQPK